MVGLRSTAVKGDSRLDTPCCILGLLGEVRMLLCLEDWDPVGSLVVGRLLHWLMVLPFLLTGIFRSELYSRIVEAT